MVVLYVAIQCDYLALKTLLSLVSSVVLPDGCHQNLLNRVTKNC